MSELSGDALAKKQEGNRAMARRDYAAAEECFRQVIRLRPDSWEGYLVLARLFERTHRHRDLIGLLEPCVDRFGLAAFHRLLGDAYRVLAARGDRKSIEQAIEHYGAFHRERKDPVTLFYLGELLAESGDLEGAFAALRESLELDPRSPTVRTAATTCARRLDRPELLNSLPT